MAQKYRRTIRASHTIAGVGLHSGRACAITLQPAPDGAGIQFRTAFGGSPATISASAQNVVFADHGTCISSGAASIATVEHLMAAFALTGVDDIYVTVDGPEIPIVDGSAKPFIEAIEALGLREGVASRDYIQICEAIEVREGDRFVRIEPASKFSVDVHIDFNDCLIGAQSLRWEEGDDAGRKLLGDARTFCRLYEIDALRQRGLIKGGSLENSIVVDGARLLNETPLRDSQEFVQHKTLDLIGDLYLAGAPIIGAVTAMRPGHDLNTRLARLIEAEVAPGALETPAALRAIA